MDTLVLKTDVNRML